MALLSEADQFINDQRAVAEVNDPAPQSVSAPEGTDPYSPPIQVPPTVGVDNPNPDQLPPVDGGGTSLDELYPVAPDAQGPNSVDVVTPGGADVTENDPTVAEVETPGIAEADTGVLGAATDAEAAQTDLTSEQQVDSELDRILGQDSPLAQRARAEAARYSNQRGLQNSSIAAGATFGALTDRALPIAQQNASQAATRELANTANQQQTNLFNESEQNRLRALEAELGTRVNVFNAEQLNQAENLSAQMRTALEQQDTAAYNEAALQLAQLQRQAEAQQADINFAAEQQRAAEQQAYNSQIIDSVASLNEQYLRGTQAMDLATIQGTYQQIITANQTAGSLFQEYINSIGNVMSNPDMTPTQIASAVNNMQRMLESSLRMISEINDMDFGDIGATVPGGSGSDTNPDGGGYPPGPPGPGPRNRRGRYR